MANEIEREIAFLADTLETELGRFPRTVGEIPGFPYSNFKDLSLAFATKELRLILKRYSQTSASNKFLATAFQRIFEILATPSERFRMNIYGPSWIFIPIISLVLGYFTSWWFILINFLILVFMSCANKLLNLVIYRGAFDSELVFCFLYRIGLVCVTTADLKKFYNWSDENIRSEEEAIGMQEETFLNADTKLALAELDNAMDNAMDGQHSLAFMLIRPKIKQLLRHNKETLVPKMRKSGLSHEAIVLRAAKFILENVLLSGEYHIYRGVLSTTGDFLFNLYTFIVKKLWAENSNQKVSEDAEVDSMREAISKAG